LLFGRSIHACAQHHFEKLLAGQPAPGVDELLDVYQAAWNEQPEGTILYGSGDTRDSLAGLADRMLKAFLASDFARPQGIILGVEEELRGPVIPGCPDLLGRVDLIVEAEDALIVSDYKTSRTTWSFDKIEQSSPQLLLYGELVQAFSPLKPVRLQFAVLPKTKLPTVQVHEVECDPAAVARTKAVVQRVWNAIKAGPNFYPNPSPMNCPTCPFRGPCQRWSG